MVFTDSLNSLTIYSHQNLEHFKLKQPQNTHVLIDNSREISTVYIRSNMGTGVKILLTVSKNRAHLKTETNQKIDFQDESKFWIARHRSQSIEEDLISIRKSHSNLYLCMDDNGIILIQEQKSRYLNKTCLWFWTKTAFGIQLYRINEISSDSIIRYLGTCQRTTYFLCSVIDENPQSQISTYWLISSINHFTSIILPQDVYWDPNQNHLSLQKYNNKYSNIFCHQFFRDLITIAVHDINDSFDIIDNFKIGLNYLRWFLLNKSFTDKRVDSIMIDIKNIIIFYGNRKRRNLFINLECSINNFKYCKTFQIRLRNIKHQRKTILLTTKRLIRLFIPLTRLSFTEKVKWLKKNDIIGFFHRAFNMNLPNKRKTIMATYFLQNYFNENNVFNIKKNNNRKNKQYYESLFVKKFEEISFGLTLSMNNENIKILKRIHQFYHLGKENVCFSLTVQKLLKHLK